MATKAKKVAIPGRVLAEGEVTGHSHRLGTSDVYEVSGLREFDVTTVDTLSHEEHGPIALAPGRYASGIVREYDHLSEEARQVQD